METNDPDKFVGVAKVPTKNQLGPHDEVPHGIAFGAASNEVWGRDPQQGENRPAAAPERLDQVEISAHATAGAHQPETTQASAEPESTQPNEDGWQSAWNKNRHAPEYPVLGYKQPGSESTHAETAPANDDTMRTVRLPGRVALGQTAGRPTLPPEEHHE